MEHFIRTVWIIFLAHWLQASPTKAVRWMDKLMEKDIKCPLDSRFYVTPENVQEKCIKTALICAIQELNGTVRAECEPHIRIDQGLKSLESYVKIWKDAHKDPAPTAANECVCEAWPQMSFKDFLAKTKTLMQRINASVSHGFTATKPNPA